MEELYSLLHDRTLKNKLKAYKPYPKQKAFHEAGLHYSERLFMAGNQLGKTVSGGAEAAMHLTGRYPSWWNGAEFKKPVKAWAAGVTGMATRDTVQRILVGDPASEASWGTGFIPHEALVKWNRSQGTPNLLDNIVVKWGGGGDVQAGESLLGFKSYEMGREKWQGATLDFVWDDEEPEMDVYSEGLTRTNNGQRGQFNFMTFTPLLGMSQVVRRFLTPDVKELGAQFRKVITMTIEDVLHYTPQERARIIASYEEHEREARTKGVPMLGSGMIFPVSDESITIHPREIPDHWPQIIGMDFGWDHPTTALKLAWDRDNDIIYVTGEYGAARTVNALHAAAIKKLAQGWVPVAWPHDGMKSDGDGRQLAIQYKELGLKMLPERATFSDGTNSVEAGVSDMFNRMKTGRWKVFNTCTKWLEERRMYHREDGKIVKEYDDFLDGSRYALMMKRFAVVRPTGEQFPQRRRSVV